MNTQNLKRSPVLLSVIILLFIFVFFQFFKIIVRSDNIFLESIIFVIVTLLLLLLIKKMKISVSFFDSIPPVEYLYYLPALLCVYIFTGGFQDIFTMSSTDFYSWQTAMLGTEVFIKAFFEELLFRGLILGLLLKKYYKSKNGILKSVIISSLIFGFIHLTNNWTQPNQNNVVIQIYGAFSVGVLFAAIYLRTRSIIMISLLHFGINFFIRMGNFGKSEKAMEAVNQTGQSMSEITITLLFIIIFFGIPLFLGLLVLRNYKIEDVEKLFKK